MTSLDKPAVDALTTSSAVSVVPCGKGHEAQVYGTATIGGIYPGDAALGLVATARCAQEERDHVNDPADSFTYTRASFVASGINEWSEFDGVVCFALFSTGRTGSLVG